MKHEKCNQMKNINILTNVKHTTFSYVNQLWHAYFILLYPYDTSPMGITIVCHGSSPMSCPATILRLPPINRRPVAFCCLSRYHENSGVASASQRFDTSTHWLLAKPQTENPRRHYSCKLKILALLSVVSHSSYLIMYGRGGIAGVELELAKLDPTR